jgi:hypothetical protein
MRDYGGQYFRGVLPVFVPSIWALKIPPMVFFLWILSKKESVN